MELRQAIAERRAYRSLEPVQITEEVVRAVMDDVRLAPSCFNNQPWRFVFVFGSSALPRLKSSLSKGNAWAQAASMIVAVASRRDLDCLLPKAAPDREYFLFDTGMATALLILRLTELGLVAHPIAGYDEAAAREAVGLPADMKVITLVIVGKKAPSTFDTLSDQQKASEAARPGRRQFDEVAFIDSASPQPPS